MPESQIGRLNLREFDALIRRKQVQDNKERLNSGIIAAAIYNSAPGDGSRKVVSALDFVPDWKPKELPVDLTSVTPQQQKDYFSTLFSGSGLLRG